MSFLTGKNYAKQAAIQAATDEAARQERVRKGTAEIDRIFGQYDDKFFDQRAQDYTNFALPTLNMEQARTRADLTYGLAGRGLLNSSIRNQREQSLSNERQKQLRYITDTGLSQANDLRARLEDARGRVYSQLLASTDPAQTTAAATRETGDITSPSPMGQVGNFFADWSNIYSVNRTSMAENPNVAPMFGGLTGGSSQRIVR